jgi:hypothetical protein
MTILKYSVLWNSDDKWHLLIRNLFYNNAIKEYVLLSSLVHGAMYQEYINFVYDQCLYWYYDFQIELMVNLFIYEMAQNILFNNVLSKQTTSTIW